MERYKGYNQHHDKRQDKSEHGRNQDEKHSSMKEYNNGRKHHLKMFPKLHTIKKYGAGMHDKKTKDVSSKKDSHGHQGTVLHKSKNRKKKFFTEKQRHNLLIILGLLVIIVAVFNVTQLFPLKYLMEKKIEDVKERAKPVELSMVILTADNCDECTDISGVIETVKKSNTKISDEKELSFDSKEGENFISKYKIKRIPAVVLNGDAEKIESLSLRNFEKREGAFIFDSVDAPYLNPSGELKGKVKVILIDDSSCDICTDLSKVFNRFMEENILTDEKKMDFSEPEAKKLISLLDISTIPVILISKDVKEYPFVKKLEDAQIEENNGYYIVEGSAPYLDLETNKIRGKIKLTMITDSQCNNCYDVNLHEPSLTQMGLSITEKETIDVNSEKGKKMVGLYNITKVPTIILSGDLKAYNGFDTYWEKLFGTVEDDGSYVFRNVEMIKQPFTDLSDS